MKMHYQHVSFMYYDPVFTGLNQEAAAIPTKLWQPSQELQQPKQIPLQSVKGRWTRGGKES